MAATDKYLEQQPARAEVDTWKGAAVLDFGTNWCGYCVAARNPIETALASRPEVRHVMAEDGPGRPLGRSFRVKLWPTLIFLRDGQEVSRLVRPGSAEDVAQALRAMNAA